MAYQLWSQVNFTKGELSPYVYSRAEIELYYKGMKQAQNVLTYPSGAAGKRFGTLFQAILSGITSSDQIYFQTFQYLDQCTYQLVFSPLNIAIYLEGILVANVTTTLNSTNVFTLSTTTLGAAFRLAGQGFAPMDLTRSANSPVVISSIVNSLITLASSALTAGLVYPVTFTGTLPTSDPQINAGIVYFVNAITASTCMVYQTAYDAKFGLDPIQISVAGSANLVVQNTWNFATSLLRNLPYYDFNGASVSYDNLTFTVTPTAGTNYAAVNISGPYTPLNSSYVGGAFFGGGGSGRIVNVVSNELFQIAISQTFAVPAVTLSGALCLLAEPAWSDARGWPQICSSYQNRALFANSASLPNGFWTSVINDYTDFGDLTSDDDDAIAWYPSSNEVNVINFIVPFRSITVHTNSGIYSSPLSEIYAITPSTFTLQLQDSTPASVLQPQAIDNQIMILSGNDLHTMIWDGINNAYTSNIVSIANEQLINDPVDETSYADLTRAGSRYVFIVNADGSMATYQTLQSESVSGFTPQIMEQSYGGAQFLQVASSFDGRAWFVVQRQIASAQSGIAITGFTSSTLTATASDFPADQPTAITFTTSGTLPPALPALAVQTYYWAVGVTADTFTVYLSQDDAFNEVNAVTFTGAGTSSDVVAWPLETIFTLEELTQDVFIDCAVYYNGTPTDTVNTGSLFNAQDIVMTGDGFGFSATGVNDEVVFEGHGATVDVSLAYIGFPINTIIEPMPLTPPPAQNTTLTKPKHIRSVRFMFNNTIGGTINGVPIALSPFDMAAIGEPPFPARGIFEMMIMSGWDDFNIPSFIIEHSDPFNIQLIGVFYSVDT